MVKFHHSLPNIVNIVPNRKVFAADYCRGMKVLHVGCVDAGLTHERIQTGTFLHFMLLLKSARVWGTDVDKKGLETMADLGIKDLFLNNAEELNQLELDDAPDIIVAMEIMEHMANPGKFLEAARKFNCKLMVSVPNAYSYRCIHAMKSGLEFVHEDHNYYFSYTTVTTLLNKHGFEIEKFLVYYWPSDDQVGRELVALMKRNPFFGEGIIFIAKLTVDKEDQPSDKSFQQNVVMEKSKPSGSLNPNLVSRGNNVTKVAFFAGDVNNFHFINDTITHVKKLGCDVKVINSTGLTLEKLHQIMSWSDTSWFEWANGPVIPASKLPKVCKIICRLHRYETFSDMPKQINWENVDHLVFIDKAVATYFKKAHFNNIEELTAVHIIPNAVDLDKFNFIERTRGFNIAFIARFNSDKNPALMVQILNEVVKRDHRFRLYMAGKIQDNALYCYIMQLVDQLDLKENFIYEGFIENMSKWLENKHILLSTSIVEGHPVNVLEAMAMGLKPVLHNHLGDPKSAFGDEYIYNTVDEAVEMILSDDYNPREYRDIIEQRYSLKSQVEQFEKLILTETAPSINPLLALKRPFISILIPTYNRENFIEESVIGALNQEYTDFEVVVVDDGSTDNSGERMTMIKDPRLRYIKKEHSGTPATRNRALSEAQGEFVLWLGSDDVLMTEVLSDYVKILDQFPNVDVIYGDLFVTDARMRIKQKMAYQDWYQRSDEMLARMMIENPIPDGSTLIRKRCYDRVGKYDETFTRAHDFELWSRLVEMAVFKHLNRPVLKWRWHDGNMSSGTVKIDHSYDVRVIELLLARHDISKLFPEIDWKNLPINHARALAMLKIALRMFSLRDIEKAKIYACKSLECFPSIQAKEFLQRLE